MELNHLDKLIHEEIRTCLRIFHKREKNKNSCETIIHDSLITPHITWMVTNRFIVSLGNRNIHLSMAWWGEHSRALDRTVLLVSEPHISPAKIEVFGRGFPASLDPILSRWQLFSSGNLLGLWKQLFQELVCSPVWITVSGWLVCGHDSSIFQLLVFYL